MKIISKLKMDLLRQEPPQLIPAVREDSHARALEIALLQGGRAWPLPHGVRAVVRYAKADGTGGAYDTLPDGTDAWRAEGNLLTLVLAPQVLTCAGRVMLSVTLLTGDAQLSLFPIFLQVAPLALAPVLESQNYCFVRGFLPAPLEASVGDHLRIAAVNAQGKVTAVEAVPLSGSSEAVPACWLSALKTGVKAINTALCNAGANKSAFLFYTDVHWNYGAKVSPRLLSYLYRRTGLNKTIFGGDIVSTEGEDYDTMAYLWDWRAQLKDLPNHHSVVGNHDDGNTTNNLFSQDFVYGYLLAAEETGDLVRGDDGLYYYIDCPAEKTRYLYLDTAYQGATEQQQTFVKSALLTAPENWHIVAVAHIWLDTDYTQSPPVPAEINADAAVFLSLFDSCNARTGDFSGCTARVEFCIGGHTHWDHDARTEGGIPILLMEADGWDVRSGLPCIPGTAGEAAVSGIITDYDAEKITVIRVGRGSSRVVSLTGEAVDPDIPGEDPGVEPDPDPTYENLLLSAVDNDGNLCPWKENTRWSGSSNAEVESSGTFLSGHIPCKAGQTVYLKDVTLLNQNGSGVIHYFSQPGQRINGAHINDVVSYWNGVVDIYNMVTQFTLPATDLYADVQYIRIECTGFDSSSVVTVGEPIE